MTTETSITPDQRMFLTELAGAATLAAALQSLDLSRTTLRRWLRQEAFKDEFDRLLKETVDIAKAGLEGATASVVGAYEDALQAEKTRTVRYECDDCGHRGTMDVTIADHATRMKAADTLLRVNNILKEKREIDVKAKVTYIILTGAEEQARLAYEAGRPIPAHMESRLVELGIIEEKRPLAIGPVTEGEFKEVS